VTTLPKNVNRDIVLELLVPVLPPPNLKYLLRIWLNGVELRNRLVGMDNGFYLQIEVTGNFRLGREIFLTPYRLLCTLHEAPPTSIHRYSSECYCFLPGRAFFLGCRSIVVQGEKKALESLLLSKSTAVAQTSEEMRSGSNQCILLLVTYSLFFIEVGIRW